MQRKGFIQFIVLFLMLIGALSPDVGFQPVNDTELSSGVDDSDAPKSPPVDYLAITAEQDLELNQLVWSHTYSVPEYANAKTVVECENGDYGVLGMFSRNSQVETILMRIDSSGNQLWNRTFHYANDTYGNSLVLCSDGGFAIAGRISNRTVAGYDIGWLARTNSTGHLQWNMTFYGSGGCGGFTDLVQTSNGGFVLVGRDFSSVLYDDEIIVAETDENGTLLWAEYYYNFGQERSGSIVQSASGGFAVSGSTILYGALRCVLMSIDSSSHMIRWYRTFKGSALYPPLVACDNGDYLVGGGYTLLRTDSDGELEAAIDFPAGVTDVVLLDANRIVVAGGNRLVCSDENGTSMLSYPLGFMAQSMTRSSNGEFVVVGQAGINVLAVARIPWLEWNQSPSDVAAEYATPLSINLNATCSQGIDSWSVNDTVHFDIDSQGVLTNAGVLDVGEYPLEIVASDALGNRLIQRFTVTVEDTTTPTWLQAPGTVFLEAGDAFYYDLNATDASGTLLWSLSAPYTFAITQAGVITNTMELAAGTYLIEVHVQDASGNILVGTLTVQVEDSQDPVYVVPPSNLVVVYGQVIEFDVVAYDISGIATWSQNCTDFTMLLETEGPMTTARFSSNGLLSPHTYYIAMVIADSSANALEDVFWIAVTEEDVLPPEWIEEPQTQNVEFGDSFSYDLNATDSSGLDHWWLGDDTYFSIDNTGLITETAPLAVGCYTITVFVNDTLGNTLSYSILVLVSDTTAPVWTATPVNQTILEDEPLDYQLSASDFSGLSSWQVNDTARFSIDSQGHLRNIVSLNPGAYWVYITVCDIYGNDLSTSISITVWKSTETITTTAGTTTTSSTATEGALGSIQIILLGLGSGIGGAALVIIIYAIVKRR